ncbi:MAG: hypothetical protein IVW55_12200 [Chloroflexi bacterium]|nr:hypothetical protein [Chloroflexota bacterium]
MEQRFSTFQWMLAWVVLLVLLAALNRTRLGHAALYYALLLMLLFLLVTQFAWFKGVLAPFRSLGPGLVARTGPSTGPAA